MKLKSGKNNKSLYEKERKQREQKEDGRIIWIEKEKDRKRGRKGEKERRKQEQRG